MQLVLLPVLWYVNEFGNSFIRHIVLDTVYSLVNGFKSYSPKSSISCIHQMKKIAIHNRIALI